MITLSALLPGDARASTNRIAEHPRAPTGIRALFEQYGQIYVGCANGLYTYDGSRYRPFANYPEADVIDIKATADGVLWVQSSRELVRFDPERNEFVRKLAQTVTSYGTSGNTVAVMVGRTGPTWISDSTFRPPFRELPFVDAAFQASVLENAIWMTGTNRAYRLDTGSGLIEPQPGLPRQFMAALPDGAGRVWTLHPGGARAWQNGREVAAVRTQYSLNSTLVSGRRGQVWLFDGSSSVRGLNPPVEFTFGHHGRVVAHEDSQGHLWVGRPDGSLHELIPDPAWEQWRAAEAFGGATPVQVLRGPRGALLLATEKILYRLDEGTRQWSPVPGDLRFYQYVLPLPDGTMLASVDDLGLLHIDADGRLLGVVKDSNVPFLRRSFRRLVTLPGQLGTIVAGNRNALLHYDTRSETLKLVETPSVANPGRAMKDVPYPNVVDFEVDKAGHLWMGYEKGLARWDPQSATWRQLSTETPVEKVRSFTFGAAGLADDIWVAHRAERGFTRIRNGRIERFTAAAGFSPEPSHFIKRDRRGWIWRGTNPGVSVSDGVAVGPLDWIALPTTGESRQYGFFEDHDGSVWIAGLDVVTHLRPDAKWFARQAAPVREPAVEWNGKAVRLKPGQSGDAPATLRFEFTGAEGYFPRRLQYRLRSRESAWRVSDTGVIQYTELAPGDYKLEVLQAGYSKPFLHTFQVLDSAPLARNWYALLALALAGLAGLWRITRSESVLYRLGKLRFLAARALGRRRAAVHPASSFAAGRILKSRYRLDRLLSTGGFSQVYEATDTEQKSGSPIVVKVLIGSVGESGPTRRRFAQEVAALQMVRHPGVVAIIDSWIEPSGEPCLAMPRVVGVPLRAALEDAVAWQPRRAAQLIEKLGSAIAAVHAHGVIHRDIKPENIVLQPPNEEPVLVDFGSSGLLGTHQREGLTSVLSGSIGYLAPERLTGHYSPASDLYSFAAVAFEVLTGERLSSSQFSFHDADDGARRLADILTGAKRAESASLLAMALHPLPEKRPRDVAEWSRQLAASLT